MLRTPGEQLMAKLARETNDFSSLRTAVWLQVALTSSTPQTFARWSNRLFHCSTYPCLAAAWLLKWSDPQLMSQKQCESFGRAWCSRPAPGLLNFKLYFQTRSAMRIASMLWAYSTGIGSRVTEKDRHVLGFRGTCSFPIHAHIDSNTLSPQHSSSEDDLGTDIFRSTEILSIKLSVGSIQCIYWK